MRWLLAIMALCVSSWAQLATMDQIPTPRQTNQTQGDSLGFASNVVSGNFLIASYAADGTFTPTIADTCGSTWTLRVNNLNNGTDHTYLWTATAACSGPNTVTFTESGASLQLSTILEYANVAGFDAVATSNNPISGSKTITTPNVTTNFYRDLIIDIEFGGTSITPLNDVAYTADFLFQDYSTTNFAVSGQSRFAGDPGTVSGSTVNSSNPAGSRSLQITLALKSASALTVSTPNIPDPVLSQTYSFQLQAKGGAGTNVWSINSGTLPCGLSLSSSGVISGTPGCSNANTIQFKVTDSAAATATANLTIHVGTSADTITRVQGQSGFGLNGITAGHIILFGVLNTDALASFYGETPIVTDTVGTIYALVPGATSNGIILFWGLAGGSGNITVSVSPAIASGGAWTSEWTNIRLIFDTGVTSKYVSSTGSSPVSSAAITSPVSEMLYAFSNPGTAAATVTPSAPFSTDVSFTAGTSARKVVSAYDTSIAAGSNTVTWTQSGNTSNSLAMTLMGFRPTVTGTAPVQANHPRSQVY